jgi:hypothetical protein
VHGARHQQLIPEVADLVYDRDRLARNDAHGVDLPIRPRMPRRSVPRRSGEVAGGHVAGNIASAGAITERLEALRLRARDLADRTALDHDDGLDGLPAARRAQERPG